MPRGRNVDSALGYRALLEVSISGPPKLGKSMPQADKVFSEVFEFKTHLRSLRKVRLANKVVGEGSKKRPTKTEREKILNRTGARCHICGGNIDEKWVVDHVFPKSLGGEHSLENYLPAHSICNRAKWFYETEEFQWILKMGVFFRTQLEELENPEAIALAKSFLVHEGPRHARRKDGPSNGDVRSQGQTVMPESHR